MLYASCAPVGCTHSGYSSRLTVFHNAGVSLGIQSDCDVCACTHLYSVPLYCALSLTAYALPTTHAGNSSTPVKAVSSSSVTASCSIICLSCFAFALVRLYPLKGYRALLRQGYPAPRLCPRRRYVRPRDAVSLPAIPLAHRQ